MGLLGCETYGDACTKKNDLYTLVKTKAIVELLGGVCM